MRGRVEHRVGAMGGDLVSPNIMVDYIPTLYFFSFVMFSFETPISKYFIFNY